MDHIILWIANNLMAQPDPSSSIRTKPMGVLGLGLSRTGTQSLSQALDILGYNESYHGFKTVLDRRSWSFWIRACLAKYRGVGNFNGDDWEQLLGNCAAVSDFPCVAFASELIEHYPDAKVILTVRPVQDWITSLKVTWEKGMGETRGWKALSLLFCWDFVLLLYVTMTTATRYMSPMSYHRAAGMGWRFKEHNAMIQGLVPSERLLIYQVSEGWEPLCKFLGKPIPDVPMPKGNKKEDAAENFRGLFGDINRQKRTNMAIFFLTVAAGITYYVYRK